MVFFYTQVGSQRNSSLISYKANPYQSPVNPYHPSDFKHIFRPLIPNFAVSLKFKSMNRKNRPADIAYFRLSLIDFLRESHPERLGDDRFILACTDKATEAYEQAIRNSDSPIQAAEQANAILFNGLHFSKHDTLVNILWNEFSDEVPEDEAGEWAMKLLPEFETVFSQYPLSDGFAYEPEYDLLYTELTGTIALYLESPEL
jgi:hypothetical protein